MTNGSQTRAENDANHARKNAARAARRLAKAQTEATMAETRSRRLPPPKQVSLQTINTLVKIGLMLGALFWLVTAIREADAERDVHRQMVSEQWHRWAAYRDANCKEVGNMYGILVGSGKQASRENGTIWECINGKRYTLANYLNRTGPSGDASPDDFPDIK